VVLSRALVAALAAVLLLSTISYAQESTATGKNDSPKERDPMEATEAKPHTNGPQVIDLVLYEKAAVAFHEQPIPSDVLSKILETITPHSSLSEWRLVVAGERHNRTRLLEAMQNAFQEMGHNRLAKLMERWKPAPLLLVFCMPESVKTFGGVPPAMVHKLALVELGMGAEGFALAARAEGVEAHWIAGALLVNGEIEHVLGIPEGYDVVFFGVAGYPREEVVQEFPSLHEVCHAEVWGKPLRATP